MRPSNIIDLDAERRYRAELERAPVVVEGTPDRECPNRNNYLIVSTSADAVQSQINALFAEVESFGNGYADFDLPRLHSSGLYFATGIAVVHPDIYPDTDIFPRPI